MTDSLSIVTQLQNQAMLFGMIKTFVIYVVIPLILTVIGALIGNFFIGRKQMRDLVNALEVRLATKVDRDRFDDSIRRVHQEREIGDDEIHARLNDHIQENNKAVLLISEKLSMIVSAVAKGKE